MPPQQKANLTIDQVLQQAVAHQRAGRLQDAERLYRAILQVQPNHPDANHNLGVLAIQVMQPSASLPHFKIALEVHQNKGQFWLSYIDALIQTGQNDAARQVLEQGRQRGLQGEKAEALALRLGSATQGAEKSNADCGKATLPVPLPSKKIPRTKSPKLNKSSRQSTPQHENSPNPQEINKLVALFTEGRYSEAVVLAQTMTKRFPLHGIGWKVLGAVFMQLGRSADALVPMQKAADLTPDDAEAHSNLGVALKDLGRSEEAEVSLRRALEIKPDLAQAHNSLGNTLRGRGRLDEAEDSFRRALAIKQDFAEAFSNLGHTLNDLGRLTEAELCYRRALVINPDFVGALNHLALLFNARGEPMMALNAIIKSLQIRETVEAKRYFVCFAHRLSFVQDDKEIRSAMVRALTEHWGRSSDLSRVCSELTKHSPVIGGSVARAAEAWPQRLSAHDLFGANGLKLIATDTLLCALLDSAPICDIEIERFLTMARCAMLDAAAGVTASDGDVGAALSFYSALARQCFINEYVFSYTDDEIQKASDLRDSLVAALDAKTQLPVLTLLAVAAYFPLYSLPLVVRLLDSQWPAEVVAVLKQQVREPEEELQLRASIPQLTVIEDEVSLLVQSQYEENPYPRWVKRALGIKPQAVVAALRRTFPFASFQPHGVSDTPHILIAGCGTGQHPIGTAQLFLGAQVLAVDLSMSSLSYAKRKARELGLTSIEFAQADLLKLGLLGRSFDVIESVGVLHHIDDPWAGWRILLSLLRPGGFMKLGFYSEVARRNVVRIRAFITENGYGTTANEIRRCRQDLVDLDKNAAFGNTIKSADFFSISTCRDLLFHVQEHRMTLPSIGAFLRENNITFLGFEIDADVLNAYKQRFSDDRAATNLDQWQTFENENPDTFSGMYQFWIQNSGIYVPPKK